MIKKITLVILLYCTVISCGVKSNPEYIDPKKEAKINEVLINLA